MPVLQLQTSVSTTVLFHGDHIRSEDHKQAHFFSEWLGLRPSDLNKYDLPDQCRLDMTENDIKTGQELMKEEFIQKNPEWMKELEIMVRY